MLFRLEMVALRLRGHMKQESRSRGEYLRLGAVNTRRNQWIEHLAAGDGWGDREAAVRGWSRLRMR